MRRLTDPDAAQRRVAEVDVLPAVAISNNRIEARRCRALWVRGMGRMAVLDNHLHAADILADLSDDTIDVLDQYVGSAFLMNSGLPAYFGGFLAGLGFDALATGALRDVQGSPILTALTVGGRPWFGAIRSGSIWPASRASLRLQAS